ncbi:MAG: hypothetical protein GY807_24360 [Gammaproteobacteria bacterium]|nr:hypothetical protein [Gammaproteobacteria bacterium]
MNWCQSTADREGVLPRRARAMAAGGRAGAKPLADCDKRQTVLFDPDRVAGTPERACESIGTLVQHAASAPFLGVATHLFRGRDAI